MAAFPTSAAAVYEQPPPSGAYPATAGIYTRRGGRPPHNEYAHIWETPLPAPGDHQLMPAAGGDSDYSFQSASYFSATGAGMSASYDVSGAGMSRHSGATDAGSSFT